MAKSITNSEVSIKDLSELISLKDFLEHPSNPMSAGATRFAVRKESGRPEFRAALIRVGRSDIVHIPSWLKAFENYRVRDGR